MAGLEKPPQTLNLPAMEGGFQEVPGLVAEVAGTRC